MFILVKSCRSNNYVNIWSCIKMMLNISKIFVITSSMRIIDSETWIISKDVDVSITSMKVEIQYIRCLNEPLSLEMEQGNCNVIEIAELSVR